MNSIPLFADARMTEVLDLEGTIKRVLDSHWYVLGSEVLAFEREFAEYCGVPYCIGVANGTDALELALRSIGVDVGDFVALAANAGFYGSAAVRLVGANPVYCDVEPVSLTLDPNSLRQALERGIKAVIVTHLYGQLADIEAITALASEFSVPIVEDCAQAHGATRNGIHAGAFGTVGCFSFYPTKNLGALGDGGAVICANADIAGRLRSLRQYGWSAKYHVASPAGRNSRLDELQAAILRTKLPHLDAWNAARRSVARQYNSAFRDLPVDCPSSTGDDYAAHLYVLRVAQRERFRDVLKSRGVASDIHYPVPDHLQPAYPCPKTMGKLHVTESASASVVSLPCFPGMSAEQVEYVIETVQYAFR